MGTTDARMTVLWFTCDPWAILRSTMIYLYKTYEGQTCLPAHSSSFVRCVFSVSTCVVLRMAFHQVHLPPGKRGLPVGHLPGRAGITLSQMIGQDMSHDHTFAAREAGKCSFYLGSVTR